MEEPWMNADTSRLHNPKRIGTRPDGFTLVELMVGVALGIFLLFGVVTVFTSTVRGSADNLRSARLNQELSAVMEMMVNDIRRAGYTNGRTGIYSNATRDINLLDIDGTPDGARCILYSYDENSNGTIEATERHGFRLQNGRIEMRVCGQNVTNCANNSNNCNTGDMWQPLTDNGTVTVSDFVATTTGSRCKNAGALWLTSSATAIAFPCSLVAPSAGDLTVETRQVALRLRGWSAQDPSITKQLRGEVKVSNDAQIQH